MLHNETLYQVALTQVPNIGWVAAKTLVEHFGDAASIFKAKKSTLEKIDGIGTVRAESIRTFNDFSVAEEEIKHLEKFDIKTLFLNDREYPKRLLNCTDSPTLLYYKGSANLNSERIISIIGTRNNSEYGRACAENLVKDLAANGVLVASGLAFGIDTIAHKASVKNKVPTVGVMAHGFGTLYPPENARLAKQMVEEGGGLLTEHLFAAGPDKHHFPIRNRIVAGMADATIVVETDIKGGSMITAELASNYNRDVLAFPGRTADNKSRGCNLLIRTNKAGLITCAQDLVEAMNWMPKPQKKQVQRSLFIEMTADEKMIADLLAAHEQLHVDELMLHSGLSSSAMAGAILSLELQGVIQRLPGKIYKIS
jgi:DNA processing protein